MPVRKGRQKGFRVSNFAPLFAGFKRHHSSEGVKVVVVFVAVAWLTYFPFLQITWQTESAACATVTRIYARIAAASVNSFCLNKSLWLAALPR